MSIQRMILSMLLMITCGAALAEAPAVQSPLPPLSIADRGERKLVDNEFSFTPWGSEQNPGKVHIIQYFGGTKSDSKIFKPFTDLLRETFRTDTYHETTIINLDAAMWGTSGFVVAEVKESKRKFPLSTMVLDEDSSEIYGGSNSRFKLTAEIEVPDNEAAYTVHFSLRNESGSSHRLELWSNSMLCPGPGNITFVFIMLQFIL